MSVGRSTLLFAFVVLATAVLVSQCLLLPDEGFKGERVSNMKPLVAISKGVLADGDTVESRPHFYWYGADTDGVVRWFEWAVDDTMTESAWTRTTRYDAVVTFAARSPSNQEDRFSDWHTFFVRAVDDDGARSMPDHRYFNAETIAPRSQIVSPKPGSDVPRWASTLRITWAGEDLDGARPDQLPSWFEYKLIRFNRVPNPGDVPAIQRAFEDSINVLRGDLSPNDFPADSAGNYYRQALQSWTRVDGTRVSETWLRSLDVGGIYGFAIRAIDEAGAVEPDFAQNRNWVIFRVANERIKVTLSEASLGDQAFNSVLFGWAWEVSVAPEQAIRFRWEGDASGTGSEAGPSNYGFDIPDPMDDSYRDADGRGGWTGWGNWRQMRNAITFPRSDEGKFHYFYLKMRDVTNLYETETDCAVKIRVARLSFTRKLLIVDDLYKAPKPCLGSPPPDAETDDYRLAVFGDEINDIMPPGESWDEYSTFGDETVGDEVSLPDSFLQVIGTYQNLIWDSGSSLPGGFRDAVAHGYLSRYVGAGGNLLLAIDRGPVSNVFDCRHTQDEPCCPCQSNCIGQLWLRGSGFLWDALRLQGCVDKPRHPTGSSRDMAPQSLIRAEALNRLYPDLVLDPVRWRCSFPRGIDAFEGMIPNENEPLDEAWYRRQIEKGGMELLYQARTLEAGTTTDSIPMAWRTSMSAEDSTLGVQRGRIVTFAIHPYFFDQDNMRSAMTFALRWVVTGAE